MENILITLSKTNTINFLLMAAILYLIIKKMNISSSLKKGVDNVINSIKNSEQEKENSQNLVDSAAATMSKLPEQIKEIEKFSEQKTEVFKKQLEESSKKSIENIKQNVQKVVAIEEKKISNHITSETVADSIEASKNNIIEMLKDKPNLKYKFIDKSLEELDRIQL